MEPSTTQQSICLPFESEAHYEACVQDLKMYRAHIAQLSNLHPELFPEAITAGFVFHDSYQSVKQKTVLRRIKLKATGAVYGPLVSAALPGGPDRGGGKGIGRASCRERV